MKENKRRKEKAKREDTTEDTEEEEQGEEKEMDKNNMTIKDHKRREVSNLNSKTDNKRKEENRPHLHP